jgi:energy-coupling factor transporter transmembrane protein EcfT
MDKIFRINERKLTIRYNLRIFFAALPAAGIIFTAFLLTFAIIIPFPGQLPLTVYRLLFPILSWSVLYAAVVVTIGSIIETILLRAHKKNSYIQIKGRYLIISEHVQTVFNRGKAVSYKKLYVAEIKDIKDIICKRDSITFVIPADFYSDRADFLEYDFDETGTIKFKFWLADETTRVNSFTVNDGFTHAERIAQRIFLVAGNVRERNARRERFRREMLERAKSAKRPRRFPDRDTRNKNKRKPRY